MRTVFVAAILLGFVGLAAIDLFAGDWRYGVSGVALGIANALLLTGTGN